MRVWRSRRRPSLRPPLFTPNEQAPPLPADRVASVTDKGHGRLEKRTLRTTTILTKHTDWAGLQQGFELTRERTVKGVTTVEVVHGITSLPPARADAARLEVLTRGHWGIENELHYKRDVTLGEDASRVRKGVAPQVLAGLRNSVVHVMAEVVAPTLAAGLRRLNNCLAQALTLLGLPQLE